MSTKTLSKKKEQEEAAALSKPQWQRATFAGVTPGDPPRATFHALLTLRDGTTMHKSFAVRVTEDTLLLRLMKLAPGTEVRVCIETDWEAKDLPTFLKDFCLVEAA